MQAKRGCLATALGYDVSDNPPCAVSSIARVSFDVIRSYFEIKDRLLVPKRAPRDVPVKALTPGSSTMERLRPRSQGPEQPMAILDRQIKG